MKNKRKTNFLKAGITIAIALTFLLPTAVAIESEKTTKSIQVNLGGPFYLNIGEYKWFNSTITGGVPPYSMMWVWGDGSSGTSSGHAYGGNKNQVYTVSLTVKDSQGKIGVGSTRVYTQLPTDNNVRIEKFVKQSNSNRWQKLVTADVGDILNIKIIAKTIGSAPLFLYIGDESSQEFSYINGSVNIQPDQYYPGGDNWGPTFVWSFSNVTPGTTTVITYNLQVIKEFCSQASLEGFAMNGICITAYPEGRKADKDSGSGWLASDMDAIRVSIRRNPGTIFYVGGSSNFTTIQSAINAASNGDTIYVYPGVYTEPVQISKSIALIGLRKPIIDGTENITHFSSAVKINADRVTVQGFTIRNAEKSGIYIDTNANNNTITKNQIINNGLEGIYVHFSENNIITDNIIMGNGEGIFLIGRYNLIKGNTIRNNQLGIEASVEYRANDIYQNIFMGNSEANAWDSNFYGNHWTGYSFAEKRFVGNYWSDYKGVDSDGDGLGDTPYVSTTPWMQGLVLDIYPIVMKPMISSPLLQAESVGEPVQLQELS